MGGRGWSSGPIIGIAILLGVGSCLSRRGIATPSGDGDGLASPLLLPDTIARIAVPLLEGRGVVLAGQRRTESGGSDAWIAAMDDDGRPMWEARVGDGFAWPEDVLVDPAGGVHVFGRDLEGAWFLSLDAEGQRRGYSPLPAGECLGFALVGTQIQLFVAEAHEPYEAELSVIWLRTDWTRMPTEPEGARLELDLFVEPGQWPDIEPLGPLLLDIDRDIHRVAPLEHGEGFRSTELDAEDLDDFVLARPSQPAALPTIFLEPLELQTIDLGRRELLLLQMPPVAAADASLLLQAIEKPVAVEVRAAFAAHAAVPAGAAGSSGGKGEHHWAWLWPFVEHDVERYADDATLGAWLSAGTCDPVKLITDCDRKVYAYQAPQYFAPADPCWRRATLDEYLGTFGRSAFRANFDVFVDATSSSYFHGPARGGFDQDYELEDPLVDTLFEVTREHGMAEQLIRAMFLDFDDHRARLDALERLEWLPLARRQALTRTLFSELRTERERCDAVLELKNALGAAGLETPTWEADLDDECDVLYVLCTGLQPNLEEQIVSPRGIEYVATCGDDRPTTEAEAESSLLSICQPETWRSSTIDYEISPEISASCGSNAALLDLRYSCGVSDDFDRIDVELATDPDGNVVIERIHILRTSVD
jgi:hypothetical protein